jgi:hypothetical protein
MRGSLASQGAAVHAATRAMARCMALSAEQERAWRAAALEALQAAGLPTPRGPALGLAPPVTPRELLPALRARRLSAMQRPLLLRAWLQAAQSCGLLSQGPSADALHLAAVALAVPMPPALS